MNTRATEDDEARQRRSNAQKQRAAVYAAGLVENGQVVGLGTGSTADYALEALAERERQGLTFVSVATSTRTAAKAAALGLSLRDLNDVERIDITIDGADEVDRDRNLIKGGGGALLREKLVAQATRRQVIVVDRSKVVSRLGTGFYVPVEIVPFGWRHTLQRLTALGCRAGLRDGEAAPFRTDNGNYVVKCDFGPIDDPPALERRIKSVSGVVESGLFIGLTHTLVIGDDDGVEVR